MLRGIYTAGSGMTATMLESDMVANNIANLQTTGFKKSDVNYAEFGSVMMNKITGNDKTEIGTLNNGVQVVGSQTAFTQGVLNHTGNSLDVALEGKGFFTVQDPNTFEEFYTRNGSFTQNAQGLVTTENGMILLSEQGNPFTLPQEAHSITIDSDGMMSVQSGQPPQSNILGQLKITQFENEATLESQGAYLYKPTETTKVVEFGTNPPTVVQGTLELSNVNAVQELIRNVTGSRRYESLQKAIHMQDQTLEQAVTQVGRYR